jgi:hypothetical protein
MLIILTQLRHVLLGEWSKKSTIENHHHIFSVGKIRKGYAVPVQIEQSEIRCMCV